MNNDPSFYDLLTNEMMKGISRFDKENSEKCVKAAILSFYAGMLGNLFKIQLNDKFHVFPNLYSMIVGESGLGKSNYFNCLHNLFREEKNKALNLSRHLKKQQAARITDIVDKELQGKKKSERKEEIEKRIANEGTPQNAFYENTDVFSTDFTEAALLYEAGNKMFGNFSLFQDELNTFLEDIITDKQYKRCRTIFLFGYESNGIEYSLKRRDQENKQRSIENFCINLSGTIQPSVLCKLFDTYIKQQSEHGFFGRIQLIGYLKEISEEEQPTQVENPIVLKKFQNICGLIIKKIIEVQKNIYERLDSNGQPVGFNGYKLKLSPEAAKLLDAEEKQNRILAKSAEQAIFKEFLRKKTTGVAKIAGLIRITKSEEKLFNPELTNTIEAEDVIEALELSNYTKENLAILVAEGKEKTLQEQDYENKLFNFITNKNGAFFRNFYKNGFTLRDFKKYTHHKLPKDNYGRFDEISINRIIDSLIDQNKLIVERTTDKVKKSFKFFINLDYKATKEGFELLSSKVEVIENYSQAKLEEAENLPIGFEGIKRQDKEEIRKKIDFLGLVRTYVKDFKNDFTNCRCIFHHDKTPSLSISCAKGKFHCFGCGAMGDEFEFLRLVQGKSLKQVINEYRDDTPSEANIILMDPAFNKLPQSKENPLILKKKKDYIDRLLNKKSNDCSKLNTYFKNRLKIDKFNNFLQFNGISKDVFDERYYNPDDIFYCGSVSTHNMREDLIVAIIKDNHLSEAFELKGIHRLYLNQAGDDLLRDSQGKRIKRMLNYGNNLSGGSVCVYKGIKDYAILCEGIETAVAISYYRNYDSEYIVPKEFKEASIYCGLSAAHMCSVNLRETNILILGDSGDVGLDAARKSKEHLKNNNSNAVINVKISESSDFLDDYLTLFKVEDYDEQTVL